MNFFYIETCKPSIGAFQIGLNYIYLPFCMMNADPTCFVTVPISYSFAITSYHSSHLAHVLLPFCSSLTGI